VADELELLARVAKGLASLPPRARSAEAPLERELERLRELMLSGREGKDAGALRQQWDRGSALLRQLRSAAEAPQVDPRSPYFAHLRLRDASGERDLCLGRASCVGGGLRIVDWRHAPVSRVFYRYRQGERYDEDFAGRAQQGEVLVRRTVEIREGALDRVDAPEGSFAAGPGGWRQLVPERPRLAGGEARALRAHGLGASRLGVGPEAGPRRSDKRLPEITGLIDPAQFDLITRPGAGFVAIRGSAGSGKTTVALHRIAYLAFEDPEIDSERTLFVALSPALAAYVSHVLPALGVNQVRVHTYPEWAAEQRRRHYPELPAGSREDTPAWVSRMKLHPALGAALAEHVRCHPGPVTGAQARDDWASVLTRRELLERTFAGDASDPLDGEAVARFCEWNTRRREEVFDGGGGGELDPEDDTLLLRAWQLRVGRLRHRSSRPLDYRHVAVDELQDFSPLELQVLLGCLDERRSLTLAGDAQQRLAAGGTFASWSAFLSRLGVSGTEVETLRVTYRSTAEIMAFARSVLGDLAEDDPPRAQRSGPAVELFRFTDAGACVAFLADALRSLMRAEPLASVALLTVSPAQSALYHAGLEDCDLTGLHRVEHQDFAFAPGVEITEIEQARGLEFDYVVLLDATALHFPATPAARRLLHVGATRAVHQLWLTSVGTPSSLIAQGGR